MCRFDDVIQPFASMMFWSFCIIGSDLNIFVSSTCNTSDNFNWHLYDNGDSIHVKGTILQSHCWYRQRLFRPAWRHDCLANNETWSSASWSEKLDHPPNDVQPSCMILRATWQRILLGGLIAVITAGAYAKEWPIRKGVSLLEMVLFFVAGLVLSPSEIPPYLFDWNLVLLQGTQGKVFEYNATTIPTDIDQVLSSVLILVV